MIVLSNSIPKTGSTLIANYQEDVLKSLPGRSGQDALKTRFSGRFIARPTMPVLWRLAGINLRHGSIVVKCHWAPGRKITLFCSIFRARMTMSYRDPRDVILSMIDHGRRTREGKDPSGAFADCSHVIDLIPRVLKMMDNLDAWRSRNFVHLVKYEELMRDRHKVLREMVSFLGWEMEPATMIRIIADRERTRMNSWNFNKGTTERWKSEMNDAEKKACREAFGRHLLRLGYESE